MKIHIIGCSGSGKTYLAGALAKRYDKLRETIKTFESKENVERYKLQITLAKRRVKAFEIANWLIENELDK